MISSPVSLFNFLRRTVNRAGDKRDFLELERKKPLCQDSIVLDKDIFAGVMFLILSRTFCFAIFKQISLFVIYIFFREKARKEIKELPKQSLIYAIPRNFLAAFFLNFSRRAI